MGELLLCHETIASLPYYAEGAGVNIYSMEELCYYIAGNTYILDSSFMNEELCTWIEKQMGLYKLAERLRNLIRSQGLFSDFVLAILEQTGYSTMQEMQDVILTLRQMEEKSDFECGKIRADQLMEKKKYLGAIYEYKRLLASSDAEQESNLLVGNIWHNLGTAYARLFLFEESAKCYDRAHFLNQAEESLKACLMSYRCMRDEDAFMKKAVENHLDDMEIQEIKNELSVASRGEHTEAFEEHLEEIALQNESGDRIWAKEQLSEIIFKWKEDYRRSSRV